MNLALPAVLLFLLSLPGLLFRFFYASGGVVLPELGSFYSAARKFLESKPFNLSIPSDLGKNHPRYYPDNSSSLLEEIFKALAVSIWLHTYFLLAFPSWAHFEWRHVLTILNGPQGADHNYQAAIAYFGSEDGTCDVIVYLTLACLCAAALGRFLLFAVREFELDLKTSFFRLNDRWFYVLRGEILKFREYRDDFERREMPEGTMVSVVVANGPALETYTGYLVDFVSDKSGNLQRLMLSYFTISPYVSGASLMSKGDAISNSNICTIEMADAKVLFLKYVWLSDVQDPGNGAKTPDRAS